MDAFCQRHFNRAYDKDSAVAFAGNVQEALLTALLDHPFFTQSFPKTTGPELFNLDYLAEAITKSGLTGLSNEDIMATLNRFSAVTIVEALKRNFSNQDVFTVYTSGGGMHNILLMQHIREMLPGHNFYTTDSLGINPDAKEAVLFAVLANECVAGGATAIGNGSAGIPSVTMGKISFPS
jgi:anhydro-N-acetylmuramic acid kinase